MSALLSFCFIVFVALCNAGKNDPPIGFEPHRGFFSAPINVVLEVDEKVFGPSSTPIEIRYTTSTFSLNDSLTVIANAKYALSFF
jgi:hypothetical protein